MADDSPTIFHGGTILTQNPAAPIAEAIALRGSRILAVGPDAHALAQAPHADVRDLHGDVLIPGFIDAHHHLALSVLYRRAVDCSPLEAPDLESVLGRIQAASLGLPRDAWIVANGFDERQISERRFPTADELESASAGHPVVLMHYTYHLCIVSTRALALLGIGRGSPDPVGGWIERDRRGRPTGLLVETAMCAAESRAERELCMRDASFAQGLAQHENALFAAGITRLADPTVSPELEALYEQLRVAGNLRISVVMLPVGRLGYLRLPEDRLHGRVTGQGTPSLRVGSLKLFADGADACALSIRLDRAARGLAGALGQAAIERRSASLRALLRFRSRLEGLDVRAGVRLLDNDRAYRLAHAAVEKGFGIAIHAVGNAAFEDAVRLLEAVRPKHSDVPPPRIEHALLVDEAWLRRAAKAGIQLVCQPAFLSLSEGGESTVPGMTILPLRSAIDAGLHVAGSSDYPVEDFRPLVGMDAAVSRRWRDGPPVHAAQAISREEALAMYTREAARACGCLDEAGTLEAGKTADLVRLSGDPRTKAGKELTVVETWVAGRLVHRHARSTSTP